MNREGVVLLRTLMRDGYRDLFAELQALTGAHGLEVLVSWLEGEFLDDERLNAEIAVIVEANHWELGRSLRSAAASLDGKTA